MFANHQNYKCTQYGTVRYGTVQYVQYVECGQYAQYVHHVHIVWYVQYVHMYLGTYVLPNMPTIRNILPNTHKYSPKRTLWEKGVSMGKNSKPVQP